MGPFHAYLKDDSGDSYRWLITFANRDTADEWWRMMSTSPSPYVGKIRRVTPHFFTQSNVDVASFFSHPGLPDAYQYHRRLFITQIQSSYDNTLPLATVSPVTITDHISGGWYFIRSKADPFSHWYIRVKGTCLVCGDANCDSVHVSSEYRTRFCIRVRNLAKDDSKEPEDLVMIGKDEISIGAHQGYTLHVNDEDLKASKGYEGEVDLLFVDLRNRFITQGEKQVNGEVWEYVVVVERGSGEPWELVD